MSAELFGALPHQKPDHNLSRAPCGAGVFRCGLPPRFGTTNSAPKAQGISSHLKQLFQSRMYRAVVALCNVTSAPKVQGDRKALLGIRKCRNSLRKTLLKSNVSEGSKSQLRCAGFPIALWKHSLFSAHRISFAGIALAATKKKAAARTRARNCAVLT